MKKIITILCCIALCHNSAAQTFSTDNTKQQLFVYQVKVMDEFFERFNDDTDTYLKKVYKEQNKPYLLNRAQILVSLMDLESNKWSADSSYKEMFRDVVDKKSPKHIAFTDSSWYAEASCTFTFNKKTIEIPVIFHIKTAKNKGYEWMIAGIGESAIFNHPDTLLPIAYSNNKNRTGFIPTSSDATNFVELHNVFIDSMNAANYFEPWLLETPKAKYFVQLIHQNKIEFQHVDHIKYHFYQLKDWVFQVSQFNRNTMNSGWLISDIKKVDTKQKEESRRQLLSY